LDKEIKVKIRRPRNFGEAFALLMTRSEPYWEKRNFFLENLQAAEFQWFFVEGLISLEEELHLPGLLSLINGIEASLRWTHRQITREENAGYEPERRSLLNNRLLRDCHDLGMPVERLAFNGETNFLEKIRTNDQPAEIVRTRNNVCHGNVFEYIQEIDGGAFFVPGNLTPVSEQVLWTSFHWAEGLGEYRRAKGFPHHCPLRVNPVQNPYM